VNLDVKDAGTRPVWVGDGLFLQTDSVTGAPSGMVGFLVDATTGEIYGLAGRDAPHRVFALPPVDPQQPTGRSNSWRDARKDTEGRVVYEQEPLKAMLLKEHARQTRDAFSWSTSARRARGRRACLCR
jgi:hypothetical protein